MSGKLGQLFGFQMNLPDTIGMSMKTTCHILVPLRNHPIGFQRANVAKSILMSS